MIRFEYCEKEREAGRSNGDTVYGIIEVDMNLDGEDSGWRGVGAAAAFNRYSGGIGDGVL